MSDMRVLVTGASIAGPALAHWLRRRGAEVTVVEQTPGLRPGGQAVDARGVAKEVIRRMGLDEAVRAACTDTAGAYTVDADGKVLETYRADDNDGDGYVSEIEVLRGDFSQVLYDDTRDGVEYVFGDRIAEITQDSDGVDVTLASGDRRRFDLVIGADGLHSALRAMVFGPREQFVRHLGLVLAFYTVPNEFGLDRWLIDYQDAGRSAGLRPVPDATRAIAMLSFPAPDFDIDYRDVEAQKRLLREQMAGFGWETQRILAHLDDTPNFCLDQVAQVVMDNRTSGGWDSSEMRRSARRRCPGRAPGWPWSAPTCWLGARRRRLAPCGRFCRLRGADARLRRGQPGDWADARTDARRPRPGRRAEPGARHGGPHRADRARGGRPSCPTTRACQTAGLAPSARRTDRLRPRVAGRPS